MKILELFAGSRSFSKIAEKRGHETYCTDIKKFGGINQVCNIFDFDIELMKKEFGMPDIIWASPPCTCFSVASISSHWTGGSKAYEPKTKAALDAQEIVAHTIWIIKSLRPQYFYLENPRGMLRKLDVINNERFIRHTVWYCQYGDMRAKPTDIWTNDYIWEPKPVCKNGNPNCHHERAPRGSNTGTQGMKNAYLRATIPELLCEEILENCE